MAVVSACTMVLGDATKAGPRYSICTQQTHPCTGLNTKLHLPQCRLDNPPRAPSHHGHQGTWGGKEAVVRFLPEGYTVDCLQSGAYLGCVHGDGESWLGVYDQFNNKPRDGVVDIIGFYKYMKFSNKKNLT